MKDNDYTFSEEIISIKREKNLGTSQFDKVATLTNARYTVNRKTT